MQIESIMRYRLTLVGKAIVRKSMKNKCWRGCGEKGPSYTVGGNHYGKQYGDASENEK